MCINKCFTVVHMRKRKEIKGEKESKQQQVVQKNRIMTLKSFTLLYHNILTLARAKH